MKKINKLMIIGIICVITGLSVVNSLTGHGIRNNPFLNRIAMGTADCPCDCPYCHMCNNNTGTQPTFVTTCYIHPGFSPYQPCNNADYVQGTRFTCMVGTEPGGVIFGCSEAETSTSMFRRVNHPTSYCRTDN